MSLLINIKVRIKRGSYKNQVISLLLVKTLHPKCSYLDINPHVISKQSQDENRTQFHNLFNSINQTVPNLHNVPCQSYFQVLLQKPNHYMRFKDSARNSQVCFLYKWSIWLKMKKNSNLTKIVNQSLLMIYIYQII